MALATVLAFASCNCKKNGECAKAQAEQQVADTTNATTQDEAQANDGSKFIDFTVPALDGKQVKLADVVTKKQNHNGGFLGIVVRSLPYGDA